MDAKNQEQIHPQEKSDRLIIDSLKRDNLNDYNLSELARLRIRYQNFPGARSIQQDLQLILDNWHLTEEELFEKTRQIHSKGKVYRSLEQIEKEDREDWS